MFHPTEHSLTRIDALRRIQNAGKGRVCPLPILEGVEHRLCLIPEGLYEILVLSFVTGFPNRAFRDRRIDFCAKSSWEPSDHSAGFPRVLMHLRITRNLNFAVKNTSRPAISGFSIANRVQPVVLAHVRQPICKRHSICKC